MGLVYIKKLSAGMTLGLWEIPATSTKAADPFVSASTVLQAQQTEKRKAERHSVHTLLKEMLNGDEVEIMHNDSGKPFLADYPFKISISHSGKYSAIFLSENKNCGIDIQQIKPDIYKAPDYFLNSKELSYFDFEEFLLQKLHVYWGAKECIYKYFDKSQLSIKNDIYIDMFEWKTQGAITGSIILENHFETLRLHYEMMEDYMLVHTV